MKREIAEVLFEHLEAEMCGENISLREDYSGRCMYGKETYAISGDFGSGHIARAWANACREDEDLDPDSLNFRTDSMGLGIVIY